MGNVWLVLPGLLESLVVLVGFPTEDGAPETAPVPNHTHLVEMDSIGEEKPPLGLLEIVVVPECYTLIT